MMRFAWKWFNHVSTVVSLAFVLAEGCAWGWCSIRTGHPVSFMRIHLQFERAVFQLFEPVDAPRDGRELAPDLIQGRGGRKK